MTKRKKDGTKKDDTFTIESAVESAFLPNSNEIIFIINHDNRPVLTIKVHLNSVTSVIKRHIFEGSSGEVNYVEYDADPQMGGKPILERVIKNQEILQDNQLQQVLDLLLLDALLYVIKWLPERINIALGQLEHEAVINFSEGQKKADDGEKYYSFSGKIFSVSKEHFSVECEDDEVEDFLKRERVNIKERLGLRGRGGSEPEYDLSRLAKHFEHTYLIIATAKKIYKQSGHLKGWQNLVKNNYPDIPPDLIERLSKAPDLDDEVLEKLESKNHTSAAQDLALEYAARLCGATPYRYTIRHLKDKLKQLGMSVKKVKSNMPA